MIYFLEKKLAYRKNEKKRKDLEISFQKELEKINLDNISNNLYSGAIYHTSEDVKDEHWEYYITPSFKIDKPSLSIVDYLKKIIEQLQVSFKEIFKTINDLYMYNMKVYVQIFYCFPELEVEDEYGRLMNDSVPAELYSISFRDVMLIDLSRISDEKLLKLFTVKNIHTSRNSISF